MSKEEAVKFINQTVGKCLSGNVHHIDVVAILETIKHDLLRQHFEAQKLSDQAAQTIPIVEDN